MGLNLSYIPPVFLLFYQGDTERAEELAQQKRDAAKALEAQVQKAKAAAAEPSEEIATTVLDPKAIPKTSAGLLTHSCMAIFEMITNGLLASDVLALEASSNVDVLYQDGLSGSVLPDASFVHWNMTGPLMLACPDEHEPQALPSWWTKCSEQLKQTCLAAIPGHMTPSSYVACCFFSVTFSLVHVRNGDPYQNRFLWCHECTLRCSLTPKYKGILPSLIGFTLLQPNCIHTFLQKLKIQLSRN